MSKEQGMETLWNHGHDANTSGTTIVPSSSTTTLSRPNPSISNSGLVIVQVEDREVYQPPPVLDWQAPSGPGAQVLEQQNGTSSSSAAHQLIHGLPPGGQTVAQPLHQVDREDESIDESVDDSEEEEEEGDDEGYRTHDSSSTGSPNSSPSPRQESGKKQQPQQPVNLQTQTQSLKTKQGQLVKNGVDVGEAGGNNLMWLLDFKLDFFNEEQQQQQQQPQHYQPQQYQQQQQQQQQFHVNAVQIESQSERTLHKDPKSGGEMTHMIPTTPQQPLLQEQDGQFHPHELSATEVVVETSPEPYEIRSKDVPTPSNLNIKTPSVDSFEKRCKKPPYTYTELITQALKDKTALTVSGIYQWITDNFPFFKAEDDRWKNSVRHNLSMNPHFRKGDKSKHGAGHLWVLADYDQEAELSTEDTSFRAKLDGLPELSDNDDDDETARAVRSILSQEAANQAAEKAKAAVKAATSRDAKYRNDKNNILTLGNSRSRTSARLPRPSDNNKENKTKQFADQRRPCQDRIGMKRSNPNCIDVQYVGKADQVQFSSETPPSLAGKRHCNSGTANETTPIIVQGPNSYANAPGSHAHATNTHANTPSIFSPMEQMEELDVVPGYCYDDEVASLEKALGIDFQDPNSQKELLAK